MSKNSAASSTGRMRLYSEDTAINNYDAEVEQRWGDTKACKEHAEKTANYTKEKWQAVNDGLMTILAKFSAYGIL